MTMIVGVKALYNDSSLILNIPLIWNLFFPFESSALNVGLQTRIFWKSFLSWKKLKSNNSNLIV